MNSQTELGVNATPISIPTVSVKAKTSPSITKYRVMICYRFILAIFGGYLLATLSAVVIAKTFADSRSAGVMSATLIAFCIHCAAFIWVFMVNKTLKATLGILLPCLILFILYRVMGN